MLGENQLNNQKTRRAMKIKLAFTLSLGILLSACSSKPIPVAGSGALDSSYTGYGVQEYTIQQPQKTTIKGNKRINTTQCNDSDDWYIDGYRVGKSFSNQKTEMLQKRLSQCGYSTRNLPSKFKTEWERGFQKGKY